MGCGPVIDCVLSLLSIAVIIIALFYFYTNKTLNVILPADYQKKTETATTTTSAFVGNLGTGEGCIAPSSSNKGWYVSQCGYA